MKKLMIAAGCAALVGAVLADGTGPDEEMRLLGGLPPAARERE